MKDARKTKEQFINELVELRQRIAGLEAAEPERLSAKQEASGRRRDKKWERMDKPLRDLIEIIHFTENVSAKVHGLLDEAEIYETVREEFAQSKRYTASILLLTDDGSKLGIAETSIPPRKLKAGEKATGLRLKGYKIDLNKSSICRQVVREGKTVQANVSDIVGELFPRPLAHLISKTMGYEKRPSILTPLKRHGKITGALAMSSTDLAGHLVPTVRILARHIATALELADEYAERKRAEERYQDIIDKEKDIIYTLDDKGNITFANPAVETISGYRQEELMGENFMVLIPGELQEKTGADFERLLRTGEITAETVLLDKKGQPHFVEYSSTTIKEGDKVVGTRGIVRDITERKQAEEELRKYRDHLEKLVEERTAELIKANEQLRREITERKRAEEALELRAEQLAALSQASQAVTASLELDQVLAEIVSLAGKVVASDYTSVVLVDEAGQLGESAENVPGVPAIEYRIRDEGLTNWIVRSRQAVVVDKVGEDGTITPDLGEGAPRFANPPIVEAGVKSFAGLPLMVKDRLLGVLYLHSLRVGAFHSQLPLLTAFANQAAIAVENARLFQAAQRELAERKRAEERIEHLNLVLRAIRSVNQLITREKDRDRLLQGVCDNLIETRGYYNAWIALLDEPGELVTSAEAGLGEDFLPMVERLKRGELTACGQRALSQPGVVVTEDPLSICADCPLADKYVSRGATTVRLEHGGKVYGLMSVSIPGDLATDEEERSLFTDVAGDIAFALHNLEAEEGRKRAEEALRESEHEKALILSSVSELVTYQDRELRIIWANRAAGESVGLPADELVSRHCYEIWQQRSEPCVGCPVMEALETGEPHEAEMTTPNGRVWSIRGYPVREENGDVIGAVEVTLEITERKRVEEALRESEERLKLALEAATDGLYDWNMQTDEAYFSPRYYTMLGYEPYEMSASFDTWINLLHPDDREYALNTVNEHIEQKREGHEIEFRMSTKSGGWRWILSRGRTIERDASGRPVRMVGTHVDITERKRAEETLRIRDNAIASSITGMAIAEFAGSLTYVNPSFLKMWGYDDESEVLGRPAVEFWQIEEKAREIIEALRDGDSWAGELVAKRKDGSLFNVQLSASTVIDETGKPICMMASFADITERKQLETQIRQLQKMEAIGQLAAGIAHDFNNLLTPISGFAELLLWKAPEGSQQQEYLRQIKVAAERATALTRQLRLFTRQARGERHPLQLNSVVEETRDLLERSIPKEITVELRLASELWAVEADPSQISQVLVNLCLNARDAMPDGGTLTLKTGNVILDEEYARTVLEAQPGRYVRLSVSDTGCGMSPEVQARLFEPFFTTKEVGEGAGLGLAVVYGIVKGHDGFIQVYSQEGRGSTFHVYLPAIEVTMEEREVEGLELPTGTETILVVDDEETVRALGQRVLELCGYTVLIAEDGAQALEVYQAHQGEIALVVLDVIMPQMSGQECLRHLRELNPQLKVLISTGYTAKGLAQELMAEGAMGMVEKPFLLQDFATAVRRGLDER